MFGLGLWEIAVIALVIVVFVKPSELPRAVRFVARTVRRIQVFSARASAEMRQIGTAMERSATKSGEAHYTLGHWGQFMDRRGDFHARNGELFRQSGAFPFTCVSCESPLEDVLLHLEENFPAAVEYNDRRQA